MLKLIRAHNRSTEFLIVLSLAFGLFSYSSVTTCLYLFSSPDAFKDLLRQMYSVETLLGILYLEIPLLCLIGAYLYARGWRLRHFRFDVSWKSGLYGLGLWTASYIAFLLLYILFFPLLSGFGYEKSPEPSQHHLPVLLILAVSIVNPIYEELFVVGYIYIAMRRRFGMWAAINTSTAIRFIYHLYQGPIAAISIIPIGVLFCYFYARHGRLWSLVVAHAFLDAVPLLAYNLGP